MHDLTGTLRALWTHGMQRTPCAGGVIASIWRRTVEIERQNCIGRQQFYADRANWTVNSLTTPIVVNIKKPAAITNAFNRMQCVECKTKTYNVLLTIYSTHADDIRADFVEVFSVDSHACSSEPTTMHIIPWRPLWPCIYICSI